MTEAEVERGRDGDREGQCFEEAPLLALKMEEEAMSQEMETAWTSWKSQGNVLSWSSRRHVAQPRPWF